MPSRTTFRIAPHDILPNTNVLEILDDGKVCAVIYPLPEGKGIKIMSAHFAGNRDQSGMPYGVSMDQGLGRWPPIPSLTVRFDPGPYTIEGGKIKRKE